MAWAFARQKLRVVDLGSTLAEARPRTNGHTSFLNGKSAEAEALVHYGFVMLALTVDDGRWTVRAYKTLQYRRWSIVYRSGIQALLRIYSSSFASSLISSSDGLTRSPTSPISAAPSPQAHGMLQ